MKCNGIYYSELCRAQLFKINELQQDIITKALSLIFAMRNMAVKNVLPFVNHKHLRV